MTAISTETTTEYARDCSTSLYRSITGKYWHPAPSMDHKVIDMQQIQKLGKGSRNKKQFFRDVFLDYIMGYGDRQQIRTRLKKMVRNQSAALMKSDISD